MVDQDTIFFLIALIGCAIGVAGFVSNMNKSARKEGQLFAKIEACMEGINDIRGQIKDLRTKLTDTATDTATQDKRIEALEKELYALRKRVDNIAKSD